MAEPFLGEIRMGGWNFAPVGWAFCNGELLPISQNQALFALIGTTYGGNGQSTFALPNLLGRVPIHVGSGFVQGQLSGEENHTLNTQEMPTHGHSFAVNSEPGTTNVPAGNYVAGAPLALGFTYATGAGNENMGAAVGNIGGSQPHSNLQPYQCVTYVVALQGIFPTQN